jgi:hypothetical protein
MAENDEMTCLRKDEIEKLFEYREGALYWKIRVANKCPAGKRAGSISVGKYRKIMINGKNYYEHRIIYFLHYGYMPKVVDHINGCPDDNRIENLRDCTSSQNQYNKRLSKTSKSGVKGVCWSYVAKKWIAQITTNKKRKYIGSFDSLLDAEVAINNARRKFHGEFANEGRLKNGRHN